MAPEAIYVARMGLGLSVIDLNGFGAGTGNPAYDIENPSPEGNSNLPNNPNLALQGALLLAPLFPGTSARDGGSAGVFTLTKNVALEDILVSAPAFGDMMLGNALDRVFNRTFPDCTGASNLCAGTQLLSVDFAPPHGLIPANPATADYSASIPGNPISWAPHPNPPPLSAAASCDPPAIEGAEPTSLLSVLVPPHGSGLTNLLVPGDFFGIPSLGLPPTGLLARQQIAFFNGPSPVPQPQISQCITFTMRQQVGHFLYALEQGSGDLVVLDSNRMHELARIPLGAPAELAMSPDLTLLAVSARASDSVVFVDIDLGSPTFHQVVHTTAVRRDPRGIAWEPGNEDIFVCNEGEGTVSILSARQLRVRKTLRGFDRPFAVAITPRQDRFGLGRNVYFAYILERSGHVALFESGPSGALGWGFDSVVTRTPFLFENPQAIQPDHARLGSGVWIAHTGQLDRQGNPTHSAWRRGHEPRARIDPRRHDSARAGRATEPPRARLAHPAVDRLQSALRTAPGHRLRRSLQPRSAAQLPHALQLGDSSGRQREESGARGSGGRGHGHERAASPLRGHARAHSRNGRVDRRDRSRDGPPDGHQPLPARDAVDPGVGRTASDGLLPSVEHLPDAARASGGRSRCGSSWG